MFAGHDNDDRAIEGGSAAPQQQQQQQPALCSIGGPESRDCALVSPRSSELAPRDEARARRASNESLRAWRELAATSADLPSDTSAELSSDTSADLSSDASADLSSDTSAELSGDTSPSLGLVAFRDIRESALSARRTAGSGRGSTGPGRTTGRYPSLSVARPRAPRPEDVQRRRRLRAAATRERLRVLDDRRRASMRQSPVTRRVAWTDSDDLDSEDERLESLAAPLPPTERVGQPNIARAVRQWRDRLAAVCRPDDAVPTGQEVKRLFQYRHLASPIYARVVTDPRPLSPHRLDAFETDEWADHWSDDYDWSEYWAPERGAAEEGGAADEWAEEAQWPEEWTADDWLDDWSRDTTSYDWTDDWVAATGHEPWF